MIRKFVIFVSYFNSHGCIQDAVIHMHQLLRCEPLCTPTIIQIPLSKGGTLAQNTNLFLSSLHENTLPEAI